MVLNRFVGENKCHLENCKSRMMRRSDITRPYVPKAATYFPELELSFFASIGP